MGLLQKLHDQKISSCNTIYTFYFLKLLIRRLNCQIFFQMYIMKDWNRWNLFPLCDETSFKLFVKLSINKRYLLGTWVVQIASNKCLVSLQKYIRSLIPTTLIYYWHQKENFITANVNLKVLHYSLAKLLKSPR